MILKDLIVIYDIITGFETFKGHPLANWNQYRTWPEEVR